MFNDTYRTISKISEGLYKDKGSKFISFAIPVKNEAEIKENLIGIKKEYYDARHHCYAYAIGPLRDGWRQNDDGEPSGTAGKPIFGQILSHDLTNILIIVIRYFGGVKLGVRGLIDAYKIAAANAIENNSIETKIIKEVYDIEFSYPLMNEVMRIIKEYEIEQLHHDFTENCKIQIALRKNTADEIKKVLEKIFGLEVTYQTTL